MSSRFNPTHILAIVILLVVLGCSKGAIPEPTIYTDSGVLQDSLTPMPTSTNTAGGLNLVSSLNVPHWDVHLSASPVLASWGPGIVYSRLLRFESGSYVTTDNASIECDLCRSWQRVNPITYVFHLKENVLWHDVSPVSGRELIAEDIVFSIKRQIKTGYPNAPLLQSIQTIEAEGKYTVRITLKSPDSDFIASLASGFTKIVAPEAVNLKGDLKDGPVIGSGPWIWDGTKDGLGYFFKANTNYYESDLPNLDHLNILVIPDEQTRIAAFRLKKLDLIESPPEEFSIIRKNHPETNFLLYKEAGTGLELGLNVNRPPLDNLQLRKAIFSSIDPWYAIDTIWNGLGFVSQGIPVANLELLLKDEEIRSYLANPSNAAYFFEAASLGGSPSIDITVADYGDIYLEYGRYLANQLETTGFHVSMNVINPMDYPDDIWYGGNYQVFVGPIAPIMTPNMYLFSVLHSQGSWNTHAYRDSTLDSLIEEQAVTLDSARRQHLLLEIQRHIMNEAVRFMPVTKVSTWVWWPKVEDFHPNLTFGEYFYLARLSEGSNGIVTN